MSSAIQVRSETRPEATGMAWPSGRGNSVALRPSRRLAIAASSKRRPTFGRIAARRSRAARWSSQSRKVRIGDARLSPGAASAERGRATAAVLRVFVFAMPATLSCAARYLDDNAAASLEHDPEKWVPVFRKDHAQKMQTVGEDA